MAEGRGFLERGEWNAAMKAYGRALAIRQDSTEAREKLTAAETSRRSETESHLAAARQIINDENLTEPPAPTAPLSKLPAIEKALARIDSALALCSTDKDALVMKDTMKKAAFESHMAAARQIVNNEALTSLPSSVVPPSKLRAIETVLTRIDLALALYPADTEAVAMKETIKRAACHAYGAVARQLIEQVKLAAPPPTSVPTSTLETMQDALTKARRAVALDPSKKEAVTLASSIEQEVQLATWRMRSQGTGAKGGDPKIERANELIVAAFAKQFGSRDVPNRRKSFSALDWPEARMLVQVAQSDVPILGTPDLSADEMRMVGVANDKEVFAFVEDRRIDPPPNAMSIFNVFSRVPDQRGIWYKVKLLDGSEGWMFAVPLGREDSPIARVTGSAGASYRANALGVDASSPSRTILPSAHALNRTPSTPVATPSTIEPRSSNAPTQQDRTVLRRTQRGNTSPSPGFSNNTTAQSPSRSPREQPSLPKQPRFGVSSGTPAYHTQTVERGSAARTPTSRRYSLRQGYMVTLADGTTISLLDDDVSGAAQFRINGRDVVNFRPGQWFRVSTRPVRTMTVVSIDDHHDTVVFDIAE